MHLIQKKSFIYLLILLCLASLTGGLVWNTINPTSHNVLINNSYDAFATHIIATQFSTAGEKKYELLSPRLNYFNTKNKTRANQPQLYIYNQQKEAWLITANYALASQGAGKIEFIRNVDISGAYTKNNKSTHLLTEKISYFPEKNFARTELPVTIVQPGFLVQAIGAEANFTTGEVNLLSKITGSYDSNTPK